MRELRDRIGAGDGRKEGLRFPAERRDGGGDRGGPGAEDGGDLVDVDQLAGGAYAGLRIGLVVFRDQLDLPAEHAAGGIDLVDHGLDRLDHDRAIGAAGTGERRQRADLDRGALGERAAGQGGEAGKRGGTCQKRAAVGRERGHDVPLLSCWFAVVSASS